VCLVTFDDKVNVVFELCRMDSDAKQAKIAAVKKVAPGGSTNLSGGMLAGMNEMEKSRDSALTSASSEKSTTTETTSTETNRVESILVFTDGEANVGVQNTDGFVSLVNDFLGRRNGVNAKCTVYGFGFGAQHNEACVRAIAVTGHGNYYYIANADDIPVAFVDCLGGLMAVAAQNTELVIRAAPDTSIAAVHSLSYKCAYRIEFLMSY
jgi:Ca-activated chloride channel family protein